MYKNTTIKPLGKSNIKFINPKNGEKCKAYFVVHVLDGPCQPVLGSKASQALRKYPGSKSDQDRGVDKRESMQHISRCFTQSPTCYQEGSRKGTRKAFRNRNTN